MLTHLKICIKSRRKQLGLNINMPKELMIPIETWENLCLQNLLYQSRHLKDTMLKDLMIPIETFGEKGLLIKCVS